MANRKLFPQSQTIHVDMKSDIKDKMRLVRIRKLRKGEDDIGFSKIAEEILKLGLDEYDKTKSLPTYDRKSKTVRFRATISRQTHLRICRVRADFLNNGITMSELQAVARLMDYGLKQLGY